MDLGALPFEIRKKILNSLDNRRDVFRICSQSPEMLRAAKPLRKQYLEAELGAGVVTAVFPDAMAVITFPRVDRATPEKTQRTLMRHHLEKWRHKDLVENCTEAQKRAAACFIDKTVIPFVEDFADKAKNLNGKNDQVCFPWWVNKDRRKEVAILPDYVFDYRPEERVRLIRAFCRFQLLSKVIQARPGPQLWSMRQQEELLKTFFDAWEVEEVLSVQQYVGDLHTLLWMKHLNYMAVAITRASEDFCMNFHTPGWNKARNRNSWFVLMYDPAHPQTAGHIRSLFHMEKRGFQNKPVRKLEFVDVWTQSTFLKHLATFGLDFLHSMLMKDEGSYKHWIRVHGDAILAKIADPAEAAHFGADADWLWIGDVGDENNSNTMNNDDIINNNSDDGDENDDPPTNLGRNPGVREGEANLAWKLLKNASQTSRYGFRRCGWVFWDEERLRKLKFWDPERDVDAENLPKDLAWAAKSECDCMRGGSGMYGSMSPAEKKLYRLAQEKSEMVKAIGAEVFEDEFFEDEIEEAEYHPLSFLHCSQMLPVDWSLITGPAEPVAATEPIWLFQGILWG
ncbi:hypothetical protein CkaCkLH20_11168 [Colletotrichum karsti]|uniref:Uncharacterized protein n=1 Tax=Colletotrichum karsti TaxID=1095194 RepID=A0A9P6LGB1_9PEZI|nr:uncharacterized protein CkaCkLH20_11168 [Colletotrichum karsti]KAF9871247.1 hypothetical protein CkaCkLH20_11168 [Colletotrichum karsti]